MTKTTPGRAARAAFDATLQAVVKFAGTPLSEPPNDGEIEAARNALGQILAATNTQLFGLIANPDSKLTRDGPMWVNMPSLLTLQTAVSAQLADVIAVRALPEHLANLAPHAFGQPVVGPLTITPSITAATNTYASDQHLLCISGPFSDVFLFVVCYLLALTSTQKVLRCECGQLFYKVGRQTHCSPACYDQHYWQGYPEVKKLRARKKWYESRGWTLGARSKKKRIRRTTRRA